ncbi:DinB family protein [Pontivivens ytuae]
MTKPLAGLVVHFFNHQTHHRGQVNAMLTAAGERPGDTDLFLMPG